MESITEKHVERGLQMRQIVEFDLATGRSETFEQAVEELAQFLGIDIEAVKLGIAIANERKAVV